MKQAFKPVGTHRKVNQTNARMGSPFKQTTGAKGRAQHAACGKLQTSMKVPAQSKPSKG